VYINLKTSLEVALYVATK